VASPQPDVLEVTASSDAASVADEASYSEDFSSNKSHSMTSSAHKLSRSDQLKHSVSDGDRTPDDVSQALMEEEEFRTDANDYMPVDTRQVDIRYSLFCFAYIEMNSSQMEIEF